MRLLLPAHAPLWLSGFANSIENKFRDLLSAPLRLMGLATAELPAPGDFSQGLVYDLTTGQIAYSTGSAWRQIFGSGNAALGAIATLTPAADRYAYFTGPATAALGTIGAFGRSLLDDADAAAARATIGVGAVGTQGDGDKGDIIVSASGAAWTVDNDAIGYAKLQNVSATDRVLGRASAGAGDVEEIAFTAAARTLAAQTTQAAMRTTGLGLGTAATLDTGTSGTKVALTDGANLWSAAQRFINSSGITILDSDASHTLGLIVGSNLSANRAFTLTTGDANRTLDMSAGSVTISAAGAALIDDADATAQRVTLGLVIGTEVQAFDAELAAIAGLVSAANKLGYFTGSGTAALADFIAAAWSSWTPTWTNLTLGNGTVTAAYAQIGKMVFCRLAIVFGSTTSISGDVIFSLPVTRAAYGGSANVTPLGQANFFDSPSAGYQGLVQNASTTTASIRALNTASTYLTNVLLSSTVPFTWATSDELAVEFFYEAA